MIEIGVKSDPYPAQINLIVIEDGIRKYDQRIDLLSQESIDALIVALVEHRNRLWPWPPLRLPEVQP
jgi:hypothetical protein